MVKLSRPVAACIENNIKLIDNNQWNELYDSFIDILPEDLPGDFTEAMLAADVNPCIHIKNVPFKFLYYSKNIKEFTIPDNCIEISGYAFSYSAIENINFSENLEVIRFNAFAGSQIKVIDLPNSAIEIGESAFAHCPNLTEVNVGSNLTNIEEYAFDDCPNLTTIYLPKSLAYISASCFYDCDKLTDINYSGTMSDWEEMVSDELGDWYRFKIHCSDGVLEPESEW